MRVMLTRGRTAAQQPSSAPGASVWLTDTSSVVRSSPLGLNNLRPSTKKRVVLSGRSSISRGQDLQSVDLGGGLAGDRRGALLIARAARAFGIAGHRHPLDIRAGARPASRGIGPATADASRCARSCPAIPSSP